MPVTSISSPFQDDGEASASTPRQCDGRHCSGRSSVPIISVGNFLWRRACWQIWFP